MTRTLRGLQFGRSGLRRCTNWFHFVIALMILSVRIAPAQEHLSLTEPSSAVMPWLLSSGTDLARPDLFHLSLNPARSDAGIQESFDQYNLSSRLFPDSPSLAADAETADSLPPPRVHRLLPTNISFVEKALWGEGGFMRTSGMFAPLTPEERESELGLRRTMLSLHQIGGFTSLGLMLGTAYFGQRVIDDTRSRSLRNDHQMFVAATIVSYSATGLLAILSPPPLIRRNEISTTTIHKTLAWVHAIGMIVTPILGSMIGRQRDSQKAHIHQIAGYFTTATYAASMLTVTF